MTPEVARKILENYLEDRIAKGQPLPVWDENVACTYEANHISVWTFRSLLKLIYKLKDDEQA